MSAPAVRADAQRRRTRRNMPGTPPSSEGLEACIYSGIDDEHLAVATFEHCVGCYVVRLRRPDPSAEGAAA